MNPANLAEWRSLYESHGMDIFTVAWQYEHQKRPLMAACHKKGLKTGDVALMVTGIDLKEYQRQQRVVKIKEDVLNLWQPLLLQHGVKILGYNYADKNGYSHLMNRSYRIDLYPPEIAEYFGMKQEYDDSMFKRFPHDFLEKSRDDIIVELRDEWKYIYDTHGIAALSTSWAIENGHSALPHYTFKMDMNPEKFADLLDIHKEFMDHRKPTKDKFERLVKEAIEKFGCLPSSKFLDRNGYTVITHYMSSYGPTFQAVRERYGVADLRMRAINGWYVDSNTIGRESQGHKQNAICLV